eukprot:CAMPEP_0197575350 /NCGR_PEP_ID=MMETSP1326-20131121/784_1 /TAXON_ID=1155430 /ORGANISM="Genus nov. species nov., Strain RCC2288" /LENGTH=65 /DNA_ID=CAMNT_0043138105 /DNA_START=34 /DNA_END=228 /DNA_ORIENTATION=+
MTLRRAAASTSRGGGVSALGDALATLASSSSKASTTLVSNKFIQVAPRHLRWLSTGPLHSPSSSS